MKSAHPPRHLPGISLRASSPGRSGGRFLPAARAPRESLLGPAPPNYKPNYSCVGTWDSSPKSPHTRPNVPVPLTRPRFIHSLSFFSAFQSCNLHRHTNMHWKDCKTQEICVYKWKVSVIVPNSWQALAIVKRVNATKQSFWQLHGYQQNIAILFCPQKHRLYESFPKILYTFFISY